jgi:3-hydroxyacyl-CoA dehydrogenase/enoyl-CoA hydratase/3-hydroxybutyryl-CoA epimerase
MSPFLLADEVGNDVGYKVGQAFAQAYGSRMAVPSLLTVLYENKLLGKKTGKGFYIYKQGKTVPNPDLEEINKKFRNGKVSEKEICDRVVLSMVNEAARCLQEKVIENPDYLDMALILGIGFPPFRGGLLRYADSLGIPYIVDRLHKFQETCGSRFAPAPLLLEMQKNNKTFF